MQLVVPGEGTWTVNPDGTITYRAESSSTFVEPTPIGYKVEDVNGNELVTDALITIRKAVVEGASCTVCDDYRESSVPVFSKIGMGLLVFFSSLFGLFFFRKEQK